MINKECLLPSQRVKHLDALAKNQPKFNAGVNQSTIEYKILDENIYLSMCESD
jgi:hypothetical protein